MMCRRRYCLPSGGSRSTGLRTARPRVLRALRGGGQNVLHAADLLDRMLRDYPDSKDLAQDILTASRRATGSRTTSSTASTTRSSPRSTARTSSRSPRRSMTSSISPKRSPITSGSTRSRRRWIRRSGSPTSCCSPAGRSPRRCPAARLPRPVPLHRRDQPARERGRPHHPRGVASLLRRTGSTRWW